MALDSKNDRLGGSSLSTQLQALQERTADTAYLGVRIDQLRITWE